MNKFSNLKAEALQIAYGRIMHRDETFGLPDSFSIPLKNELIKLAIEINEKHFALTGKYIADPKSIVFADEPVFFDYLCEVLSKTEEYKRVFPDIDPADFYMEGFEISEEQEAWLDEQESKWDGSFYLGNE